MKKVAFIFTIVLLVLAILFLFLPLGSLGIAPGLLAVLGGFWYVKAQDGSPKKARMLLGVAVAVLLLSLGKMALGTDEVVLEKEYEEKMEQSQQEAIEELEELEGLEE